MSLSMVEEARGWDGRYPSADSEENKVARAVRDRIGKHLREHYRDVLNEKLPPALVEILRRL